MHVFLVDVGVKMHMILTRRYVFTSMPVGTLTVAEDASLVISGITVDDVDDLDTASGNLNLAKTVVITCAHGTV